MFKLALCLYIMVTVDVLSKQCNLFDALISQLFDLFDDAHCSPVSFTASNERHDAEATHVVASSHDADPCM